MRICSSFTRIAFSLLLSISLVTVVSANLSQSQEKGKDPITEKKSKQELTELQQQIKQLQENLSQINQSKNIEINQLKTTDLEINQLVQQVFQLDQKIIKLNKDYSVLEKSIKLNQQQLDEHQEILSAQLNASYYAGQQEFIKLILNQQNPAIFGRIMTYYQYFNRQRSLQIEDINLIISKLDQQRANLSLLQQEIELQQYLKSNEKLNLEKQQQQRNVLITQLSKQQQDTSTKVKQLEKNESQLKNLITDLQQIAKKIAQLKLKKAKQQETKELKAQELAKYLAKQKKRQLHKPFSKLKRKLKWPLKGRLKKLYGHWRSLNKVKWHGNIIVSKEGKNVYSVSHGKVVYSDWLRGYGLLTIIDHGKGYMSLYGYSQAVLKSVGDEVEEGDIIATAGRTSGRKKAGIYFEIRYNGKPTNPNRWCRKMPRI